VTRALHSQIIRATVNVNLEAVSVVDTIMLDSRRANRLAKGRMIGRLEGKDLGAKMRVGSFSIRSFTLSSSMAAVCLAMLPQASHAFTQDDQRRLCAGDAMRLCASEIPDVERITACMRRQRANLSEGCRSVFGKPTEQSASAAPK
jgi:hypothetical protein